MTQKAMTKQTKKSKPVNIKLNSIDELTKKGYLILEEGIPVSNKIDKILRDKQITPADLSKMTGISRQNINSVMKGKMKPGVDFVLKVIYVLDTPIEEIFQLKESAWVSTAKSTEESTLYVDLVGLRIIDGKTKKEEIFSLGFEYYDTIEKKELTEEEFKNFLNEYIDDNLNITVVEMSDQIDTDGRKLSQKSLEALAKEKLKQTFEERYIKKYRKLAKKVTPIINRRKKI
ncbi:TPA: helix-turn-helix transcriptional regulator [Clostridium botulinum]|nr:helix-turn-helix transcriptional regulator [Clostridium botulinum]